MHIYGTGQFSRGASLRLSLAISRATERHHYQPFFDCKLSLFFFLDWPSTLARYSISNKECSFLVISGLARAVLSCLDPSSVSVLPSSV